MKSVKSYEMLRIAKKCTSPKSSNEFDRARLAWKCRVSRVAHQ